MQEENNGVRCHEKPPQIVAICVIFAAQYVLELHALGVFTLPAYDVFALTLNTLGFVGMTVATVLAVVSGVIYAKDSADLFKDM